MKPSELRKGQIVRRAFGTRVPVGTRMSRKARTGIVLSDKLQPIRQRIIGVHIKWLPNGAEEVVAIHRLEVAAEPEEASSPSDLRFVFESVGNPRYAQCAFALATYGPPAAYTRKGKRRYRKRQKPLQLLIPLNG